MGTVHNHSTDAEVRPTVGARLADVRKAAGLSLSDVAAQCGVRVDYVRAIEKSNFSDLPTLGYAIGYVRAYAQLLNLPASDMVEDFKAEVGGLKAPQRRFWTGSGLASKSLLARLPRGSVPALGVIAAVVMIGSWYGLQLETVASPTQNAPINVDVTAVEDSTPVADNIITLRTNAPSWISIRDGRGRMVVNRVFVTGESWQSRQGEAFTVSVRDGGAVTLYKGQDRLGNMGLAGEPVTDFDLRQLNASPRG